MEQLLITIAQGLVEKPEFVKVDTDAPNEDGIIVYHCTLLKKTWAE